MLYDVKFVVSGRLIRTALLRPLSVYPVLLLPSDFSHQVRTKVTTIVKTQRHTGGSNGDESHSN